jgi:hypothetical protein
MDCKVISSCLGYRSSSGENNTNKNIELVSLVNKVKKSVFSYITDLSLGLPKSSGLVNGETEQAVN